MFIIPRKEFNRFKDCLFLICYHLGVVLIGAFVSASCTDKQPSVYNRPADPWAFRSVLDKRPRMLTLALDSACYVAYDLERCIIYKVWKGGVTLEGANYTDKKNVQPTSWGKSYFTDSLHHFQWAALIGGKPASSRTISKGYSFHNGQIELKYLMVLGADTITIEERPEFVRHKNGKPGFERIFTTSGVPQDVSVSLISPDSVFSLTLNGETRSVQFFNYLAASFPPQNEAEYDHRGRYFVEKSDCLTCHETDRATVGPSFVDISKKYPKEKTAIQYLVRKVREGGSGVWGTVAMNTHPTLAENEIRVMIDYILSLNTDPGRGIPVQTSTAESEQNVRPGFGAPLEGLHPSYTVNTLHRKDFQPRVGGLAFLPDGRLLVTTWDETGSVYALSNVQSGDSTKVVVKRMASGLAEPLGIEVVDGEIYVLQKQELTRLVDIDGDDVTDVYEAVCNSWGVTADFHEFAFGLVYKGGYFYATLSMAMRLMSGEKQQPDRGRAIKIARDGTYEWINFGLRTPNGIGVGPDNELFVADNQGEWTPANKLIHVKQGEYHGMRWGLPDSLPTTTPVAAPAIYLPENEIANSPSEPVLMQDGPYKGQLIHGDVTYGGIQRDFLEKVNDEYQGAVFRFTQGLEAGVNRLCWGPDSALYIGEVGMVGGWTWKERQYGLQRMKYNGKSTFEMLAIRAKPKGFEIEFTMPLEQRDLKRSDFIVQQWWYLPTQNYGGPKMDLENLKISAITISGDRKKVYLEIPGLKKERVVYFRLPDELRNAKGESLWSSEAWYTLNNIPQ